VRERFGATYGIGVTGIAGPAAARRRSPSAPCTSPSPPSSHEHRKMVWPMGRALFKLFATQSALDLPAVSICEKIRHPSVSEGPMRHWKAKRPVAAPLAARTRHRPRPREAGRSSTAAPQQARHPATPNRPETIEETAEMIVRDGGQGRRVRTDHRVVEECGGSSIASAPSMAARHPRQRHLGGDAGRLVVEGE